MAWISLWRIKVYSKLKKKKTLSCGKRWMSDPRDQGRISNAFNGVAAYLFGRSILVQS